MRRDPRVALSVTDSDSPYRMAAILGRVLEVRPDEVRVELEQRSIEDLTVAVMADNAGALRLYEGRGLRPTELVLYRFGSPGDRR